MHGGQNQIVFVKQGITGQVTRRTWRVECQLCQEPFPRWIASRNLLELLDIRFARFDTVVKALELRPVPAPHGRKLAMPAIVVKLGCGQRLDLREVAGGGTLKLRARLQSDTGLCASAARERSSASFCQLAQEDF